MSLDRLEAVRAGGGGGEGGQGGAGSHGVAGQGRGWVRLCRGSSRAEWHAWLWREVRCSTGSQTPRHGSGQSTGSVGSTPHLRVGHD